MRVPFRAAVDTNILLRARQPDHPHHRPAVEALARLAQEGYDLCLSVQNVVEFWVVATRPREANGFGWTAETAAQALAELLPQFTLYPDPPDLLERWIGLVTGFNVVGVRAHDARIAALMMAHGLRYVLTFNADDFRDYPDLTCLDPEAIAAGAQLPDTAGEPELP